jgi:hypothetical protein
MRLSATLSVSCVLTLILGSAFPGLAGQPPSCIKAASSKNGNFLVLMNMQLDPPQSKGGVTMRFSFEIFPKENFLNAKDRLTAPGTYFAGLSSQQWGVALDSRNGTDGPFTSFCPLPLVTDNGEFLILLAQTPAFSADEVVLRIYRWDRTSRGIPGNGRLVEEFPLKKFYFPLLESHGFSDESPSWFAGGSWNFSSDNGQLIYKSQYGNTVRITLANGSVSSE